MHPCFVQIALLPRCEHGVAQEGLHTKLLACLARAHRDHAVVEVATEEPGDGRAAVVDQDGHHLGAQPLRVTATRVAVMDGRVELECARHGGRVDVGAQGGDRRVTGGLVAVAE